MPFCCFFFRKWIKNAGKNHALINRNYVRSRGRALPPSACLLAAPLKHRVASWPQLEQARVNKANARRESTRNKKKAKKPSEIKSNYVLMNGKMSKWFTVHNRHLVPGNPSCPQSCSCSCASAWPGATFLSRLSLCPLLGRIKNVKQNESRKNGTPAPLTTADKKRQRQSKNSNFIFALREF